MPGVSIPNGLATETGTTVVLTESTLVVASVSHFTAGAVAVEGIGADVAVVVVVDVAPEPADEGMLPNSPLVVDSPAPPPNRKLLEPELLLWVPNMFDCFAESVGD